MPVDFWSYQKKKRLDERGFRWHFAVHSFFSRSPLRDDPYEVLFRDDDWKELGLIRFEHYKDNPYRFEKLFDKIMNNKEFRRAHLDASTRKLWRKNWK